MTANKLPAWKYFCAASICSICLSGFTKDLDESSVIDNSSLIPAVRSDRRVKMEGFSPEWVKSLIMAEFRIETATPGGTFSSAVKVLDHYAETGVNGLWVGPIFERPAGNNGYGNFGPDTIETALTGETSLEKSYREIKRFVEAAHDRNIRVIFDIVAWGVTESAPLFEERRDFFIRQSNEEFRKAWGGYLFDWKKPEFREWFNAAAVRFIEETGADGFRVDLAPDTAGYHFKEIRDELYRRGHKIMIMSEMPSEPKGTFDFAQLGVNGWTEPQAYGDSERFDAQKKKFGSMHDSSFIFRTNVVDAIKSGVGIGRPQLQQKGEGGLFRFYAASPLYHDGHTPFVKGNRVRFGYLALLPFIPVWWIGEEWNNPRDLIEQRGAMYYNRVNWDVKKEPGNAAFFEDVKRILRVRRSYPDIFEEFSKQLRASNIRKAVSFRDGQLNPLQAYMRYCDDKAIVVVPNYESQTPQSEFAIEADLNSIGFNSKQIYCVKDLMSDRQLAQGLLSEIFPLHTVIPAEHLGLYLIESGDKK